MAFLIAATLSIDHQQTRTYFYRKEKLFTISLDFISKLRIFNSFQVVDLHAKGILIIPDPTIYIFWP
jgi:hypothetical protein